MFFFFSSRRRHTRCSRDWSSDVCSSDLGASLGTGPVDAVYKAINLCVKVPNTLTEFSVKSITEGIDAIGEGLIRIESDGITYTGRGADTDIIVSSAKAYINALNRLLSAKKKQDEKNV